MAKRITLDMFNKICKTRKIKNQNRLETYVEYSWSIISKTINV